MPSFARAKQDKSCLEAEFALRCRIMPNPWLPGNAPTPNEIVSPASSRASSRQSSEAGSVTSTVPDTFRSFSKEGNMNQRQFTKLCVDAGILDSVAADITFNKIKGYGQRTINLKEFRLALEDIAIQRNEDLAVIKQKVAGVEGPILSGTVPKKTQLHDGRKPYNHRGIGGSPWNNYVQPPSLGLGLVSAAQ